MKFPFPSQSGFARSQAGFTLIELLVVVVILGILAALLLPVIGKMQDRAAVAASTSNLRQLGAGFGLYAAENNNRLPAARGSDDSLSNGWADDDWWMVELTIYLAPEIKQPTILSVPDVFRDPVYERIIGRDLSGWQGGYAMNGRLNLAVGEFDDGTEETPPNSTTHRFPLAKLPGNAILLAPFSYEYFVPKSNGDFPLQRLMRPFPGTGSSPNVDHRLRIGMNRDGTAGKDALYLMTDFSVRRMTPEETIPLLKLRK